MKKIVILNASPRKDKNTATLLKEVQRGAVDMEQKQWFRDHQWPKDQQAAYELGKRLVEK